MVAASLAKELAKRGFEVHFFSYKIPFPMVDDPHISNFHFHRVNLETYPLFRETGMNYGFQLASCLLKVARTKTLDLINTHYAIPHAMSAVLARIETGIPVVNTLHGSDVHTLGNSPSFKETLRMVLKRARTTAVSGFLANMAKDVFELDRSPKVIYNFVDANKFTPKKEKENLTIVAAGNFRPVKNFPFLVECYAELAKEYPDWKLRMIGDGPERPLCFKIAMKLDIADHVEFIPPTKDIPSEFANASILAAPSKTESFGLTIAEGMSSGLPIWASNVGGIPEVCIDGENGLLFNPQNKKEGVEKLRILMDDPTLRSKLGSASRQRIIKHFHPDKILLDYIEEFKTALDSS